MTIKQLLSASGVGALAAVLALGVVPAKASAEDDLQRAERGERGELDPEGEEPTFQLVEALARSPACSRLPLPTGCQ